MPSGGAVPRFFFHFVSNARVVRDDTGTELRSLAGAHLHAFQLILRTMRLMDGGTRERWTVQIADEAGKDLLTVLFPVVGGKRRDFGKRTVLGRRNAAAVEDTPAILRSYAAALRAAATRDAAAAAIETETAQT